MIYSNSRRYISCNSSCNISRSFNSRKIRKSWRCNRRLIRYIKRSNRNNGRKKNIRMKWIVLKPTLKVLETKSNKWTYLIYYYCIIRKDSQNNNHYNSNKNGRLTNRSFNSPVHNNVVNSWITSGNSNRVLKIAVF